MDLFVISDLNESFFAGHNPDLLIHVKTKYLFPVHLPELLRGKGNFSGKFVFRRYKPSYQHLYCGLKTGLKSLLGHNAAALTGGKLVRFKGGYGFRELPIFWRRSSSAIEALWLSCFWCSLCVLNTLGS